MTSSRGIPSPPSRPKCARIFWASPPTPRQNPRGRSFEAAFKGRLDTKTDIQQQKFGSTAVSYIAALTFNFPSGPKQTGEVLSTSFSSPASANRAYFIARNLTFAQDQQPSRTEMIKQVMDKYGAPTIVGDQHLYYVYRAGKIVSVGAKYKEATALEAIDRPLDPRAAIKLDGANGHGSCVAAVKRSLAKEKTLSAMLDEAKAANCDGTLSVQLTPGIAPDRIGDRAIHAAGFQAHRQRGRDRRRCSGRGKQGAKSDCRRATRRNCSIAPNASNAEIEGDRNAKAVAPVGAHLMEQPGRKQEKQTGPRTDGFGGAGRLTVRPLRRTSRTVRTSPVQGRAGPASNSPARL